ncbi:hypothetical protein L596_020259 [Steinernema carpocapsae]|nr:hypothetical protein L596_020259 [Steinernema carpocapsae]
MALDCGHEDSFSLLFPLFKRSRLEPTITSSRRLWRGNEKCSFAVAVSLSLLKFGSLKYYARCRKEAAQPTHATLPGAFGAKTMM